MPVVNVNVMAFKPAYFELVALGADILKYPFELAEIDCVKLDKVYETDSLLVVGVSVPKL